MDRGDSVIFIVCCCLSYRQRRGAQNRLEGSLRLAASLIVRYDTLLESCDRLPKLLSQTEEEKSIQKTEGLERQREREKRER